MKARRIAIVTGITAMLIVIAQLAAHAAMIGTYVHG